MCHAFVIVFFAIYKYTGTSAVALRLRMASAVVRPCSGFAA
jgi:hypothetical protein